MSWLRWMLLLFLHLAAAEASIAAYGARLVTSLLGSPTHCGGGIGRGPHSCTLTVTCWIGGGRAGPGCGGPAWLLTCCNDPAHSRTTGPAAAVLRRRADTDEIEYLEVGAWSQNRRRPMGSGAAVRARDNCGVSREDRYLQKRIVGGRQARFGQFPWQAHIRIAAYQCGGVLVSWRYVATAAHCIIRARLSDISVYLGELDTLDTGQVIEHAPAEKYRVTKKIIHPLFEYRLSQPDRFDVALLRLNDGPRYRTEHIVPICLPTRRDADMSGAAAVVAGWGKVQPTAEQPGTNVLRSASVPILDTNECIAWHRSKQINVELFPEMLCAGHADGHQDACLGDSGGPLIIQIEGRWTLVGITSAGFGCGEPRQPGIYHSVSVTASWIRHIINL